MNTMHVDTIESNNVRYILKYTLESWWRDLPSARGPISCNIISHSDPIVLLQAVDVSGYVYVYLHEHT